MPEIYIYKCEKCNEEFKRNQKSIEGNHIINSNCGGKVKFLKIKEPDIVKSSKLIEETATIDDFVEITKLSIDALIKCQYEKYLEEIDNVNTLSRKPKYCTECGSKLREHIEASFEKSNWKDNQIKITTWRICLKCKEKKEREDEEQRKKFQELKEEEQKKQMKMFLF